MFILKITLIMLVFTNLYSSVESNFTSILNNEELKYLKEKKVIKFCSDPNWYPYESIKDGKYIGMGAKYIELFEKRLNIPFELVVTKSWKESKQKAKNRQCDILVFSSNSQKRRKFMDVTKPYYKESLAIITKDKEKFILSLQDIKYKRVSMIGSYSLVDTLKEKYPDLIIVKSKNIEEGVRKVLKGEVYAHLDGIYVLNYYLNYLLNVKDRKKLKIGGRFLDNYELGLATRKDEPLLNKIFQKMFDSISENEYIKILNEFEIIKRTKIVDRAMEHRKYLKNKKVINMCVDPNWYPYEMIKDGKYIGIGSEFVRVFERRLKIKFNLIKTKTWEESKQKAKNRECDILALTASSKKLKKYMNITKPYFKEPLAIMTNKDKKFIVSAAELNNKKISMIAGYFMTDVLKEKYPLIDFVESKDIKEAIKKIKDGKVYGHLDGLLTLNYSLKNSDEKLKISGILEDKFELGIASRNDEPILNEILSDLLESIDKDIFEEIIVKYNILLKNNKFDYTVLIYIGIVVLIIFIFILYRNHLVKKQNEHLSEVVKEKTQELEKLNNDLENKVKIESRKNSEKDEQIFLQSKMVQMGEMIGNIAHQWRQPLSVISTNASALSLKYDLTGLNEEDVEKYTTSIIKSCDYLSQTIDTFRDFLKDDSKKEPIILEDKIDNAIYIVSSTLTTKNINIINNIDYDNKTTIVSYKGLIIEVIINILNNAKDILVEKNIKDPYIKIDLYEKNKNIFICISDNGGGVPDNIIDKIFEPYFTTKHKSQGTGLGLHMSYRIICEKLKGNLSVENDENGAKFIIELPVNLS